ncbi:orotidine-5'-phosphate decarboxylase [Corynebacterium lizhenjunii]|uniref:Orotidine-5'-phosphate decarboxylase n=1 Tax=Corynebacterium lizhenjunii TaxID=2709394 RepID=A0A7T0KCE5_9CORY|nr:orotidine-5'-phosphate decarboxylase [Corynebacterium lizhenjunii]QPK78200.1 orotidine-5'-phosphate decarboxylase [Corynebacterium lizhenjunii]
MAPKSSAVGLPTFGQRLANAGRQRGRLCVGIDPHAHLLKAWGLGDDVTGLERFTAICVEAFAQDAALVKPQVAFFERFGSRGFAVLERALADLRDAGCLTLADAKRGDIGSTMAGYATAWLDPASTLCADAVTVSPYLGVGALDAVFAQAQAHQAGVFVLAATSNPEAREVQFSRGADGRLVCQAVVDECAQRNAVHAPQPGNVGVVVGATVAEPPQLEQLNGPVLLPGVGAQGASAADVKRITAHAPELGFANVSRSILSQGPDVQALRDAVRAQAEEFGS